MKYEYCMILYPVKYSWVLNFRLVTEFRIQRVWVRPFSVFEGLFRFAYREHVGVSSFEQKFSLVVWK